MSDIKRFKGYDWRKYTDSYGAEMVTRNCIECSKTFSTKWTLDGKVWTASFKRCVSFTFRRVYLKGTILFYAIRYCSSGNEPYRRFFVDCEDAPDEFAELLEHILFTGGAQ